MNFSAAILLILVGMLFFALGDEWIVFGILCFLAVFLIFLMNVFSGTAKAAKSAEKTLTRGIEMDLEKASGQYPNEKVLTGVLEDVGKQAGDFSKTSRPYRRTGSFQTKEYSYQSPNTIDRIFNSAKSLTDMFKKLFD